MAVLLEASKCESTSEVNAPTEPLQDDALNPFIPKVGKMILEEPTSAQLRRIKADNFLRDCENSRCPSRFPAMLEQFIVNTDEPPRTTSTLGLQTLPQTTFNRVEVTKSRIGTTYTHQRLRLTLHGGVPSNDGEGPQHVTTLPAAQLPARHSQIASTLYSGESQQDFAEVTNSMIGTDLDRSELLAFEMLEPGQPVEQHTTDTSHAPAEVFTLQPVPTPVRSNQRLPSGRLSCMSQAPLSNASSEFEALYDLISSREELADTEKSDIQIPSSKLDAPEDITAALPTCPIGESLASPSKRAASQKTTALQRRLTANRHARLIDGSIFPFRCRKSTATRGSIDEQDFATGETSKRSSLRLSWTQGVQKDGSRGSWLHGIRSLFQRSQNKSPRLLKKSRPSFNTGRHFSAVSGVAASDQQDISALCETKLSMQQPDLSLCLDGACNGRSSPAKATSTTSSNLNKPLPLTPDEAVRSFRSSSKTPSLTHSADTPHRPLTASTASTNISQTSSRRDFKAITKELLTADIMPQYRLMPKMDPNYMLQPLTYDPKKSPPVPTM